MKFIPKFMKTPTWAILGTGITGGLVFMSYKKRLDNRLSNPIVEEAIHLLENNDEVIEMIGAPILVESSVRNRADIGDDISNFAYTIGGPRGKLRVELASCSRKHGSLGPNLDGKKILENSNKVVPNNINEFNYNEYYIPDKGLVESENDLFDGKKTGPIEPQGNFWHIEYLFAEVDEGVRIMVAPIPNNEKEETPILQRNTYEDLAKEYQDRRESRRDFRKAQTPEEQEELRKFRLRKMYQGVAYTRFYMLSGLFFVGMGAYIIFRKNKRISVCNSMVHEKAKMMIESNKMITSRLGNKILFPELTLGAKIGNEADFTFMFIGEGTYGEAHIEGIYDEDASKWSIEKIVVETFDKNGVKLDEEYDFEG